MSTPNLTGWLPITVTRNAPEPGVEWCHFGKRRFTESFFENTLQSLMHSPFHLVFRHRTSLDALVEWQTISPGLQPNGFIFHMSRCGSTLVTQMLAKLPRHIVLSEPPPLDAILRMNQRGASDEQRIAWLRGWMSAIGQPRNGEGRLFVKLDAWHTFDLALLRRAFPDTPWIFLYRNPVEVLVSALKVPAPYLVPGMTSISLPDIDPGTTFEMPRAEYCARMFAAICSAGLEHLNNDEGGIAINYLELPQAVTTTIAKHFGLQFTSEEVEAMNAATEFHAKARHFTFEPDTQSKQSEATDEMRAACARFLDPLYAQLRAL
jgi:hypothetical protein